MPTTPFNPTIHGFHFSNNDIIWKVGPVESKFLCGGMAYAALDFFLNQMSIPPDTKAPKDGTPLNSYIFDRQVTAHINTIPKFSMAFIPIFGPIGVGIHSFNVEDENKKLISILNKGTPVPICLVRLGHGHHILATACNPTGPILITAYDPNAPDRLAVIQRKPGGDKFKNSQAPSSLWDAFFVDTGYKVKTPTVFAGQSNWRWCRKCQGLFFFGHSKNGFCPAGGSHDMVGSGNYMLSLETGNGQPNWRWCFQCEGLFFAGNAGSLGVCPAGGVHGGFSSGNYILAQDGSIGQSDWRWCRRCEGLFFAGNNTLGVCPANPNGHDVSGSGNYFLTIFSG